jgi:hypothetical protein
MRGADHGRFPGALIGKAMKPVDSGTDRVKASVTLQYRCHEIAETAE